MKISDAINQANALTGQTFDQSVQLRWLSEIDGQMAFDLYKADTWQPYTVDDLNSGLLIPFPWDGVYVHHLEAMAYFSNGEYQRYDNAKAMRDNTMGEFRRFVERTRTACGKITIAQAGDGGTGVTTVSGSDVWVYISAYGLAVLHGYQGTPEEWLDEIEHYNREAAGDAAVSAAAAKDSELAAESSAAQAAQSAEAAAASATQAAEISQGIEDYVTAAETAAQNAAAAQALAEQYATAAETARQAAETAAAAAANAQTAAEAAQAAALASAQAAAADKLAADASAAAAQAAEQAALASQAAAAASAQAASEDATAAEAAKTAALAAQGAAQTASSAAQSSATAAANSAASAATAASNASAGAEDSEAWAVGQRGGADVPATDETYHNNAKYWAEQAEHAAGGGVTSVNGMRGAVTLTQDNVPAGSTYARVTPAQVQQIADNAGAISGIKDGASINSFAGVETALAGKQNTLTFDQTPTAGSSNPVTSDGIATALADKAATASVPASMAISAAGVMTFSNAGGTALFTGQLPIYDGTAVTA